LIAPMSDLTRRRDTNRDLERLLIYCGVSHEATRDPKLNDEAKTPGSGMATPKGDDEAPNG